MLLRQIKYFVSVVKNGSFTLAAEECYISQSAISQQIHALEEDLGVQLLQRKNRSFTLTEAGEYFYRHSLLLLDDAQRLKNETARIAGKTGKLLRIGYLTGYQGQELNRAVAAFSAANPEVDIQIISGSHEQLRDLVLSGEIELSFSDQRRAFSDTFNNFHLYSSRSFVELSSLSPLCVLGGVTVDDLKRIPCILVSSREQQDNERDYIQTYLGFSGSYIFAESLEQARLLVSANKGFMPIQATATIPQAGTTVRRVPLLRGNKQVERSYYAFWPKENPKPEVEQLVQLLYAEFQAK